MTTPLPNAILTGGFADEAPGHLKVRYVADLEETIKVPLGNRFEHFRPTGDTLVHNGLELRVFAMATRTFVAE